MRGGITELKSTFIYDVDLTIKMSRVNNSD